MAFQIAAAPVRSTLDLGLDIVVLKFKFTNAASNVGVTLLSGQSVINNGGSIVITTNTNACVAKVTFNSSVIDVPWLEPSVRDDSLVNLQASVGNVTNEAPNVGTSLLSCNIAYFQANATVTTNNVNANSVVVSATLFVQRAGPKPLTPGT